MLNIFLWMISLFNAFLKLVINKNKLSTVKVATEYINIKICLIIFVYMVIQWSRFLLMNNACMLQYRNAEVTFSGFKPQYT